MAQHSQRSLSHAYLLVNNEVRALPDKPYSQQATAIELGNVLLTKRIQAQSARQGSAQWVNASYKIAIQGLYTRVCEP